MSDAEWMVWFCLVVADTGDARTVFHDRIDGLILPACEPLSLHHHFEDRR